MPKYYFFPRISLNIYYFLDFLTFNFLYKNWLDFKLLVRKPIECRRPEVGTQRPRHCGRAGPGKPFDTRSWLLARLDFSGCLFIFIV